MSGAVVVVVALIAGIGSRAGTSVRLAPEEEPSASALAGEARRAGLIGRLEGSGTRAGAEAEAEAACPDAGPGTEPVEYWQATARLSQFSQGCCELQAFFWRTQRSQARRRPEAGAGVPSHDCR